MSPKNKRKTIRGVMPFLEIEHSENVSGCIQLDTTRTRNIVLTSALYFGCRFSLNKKTGFPTSYDSFTYKCFVLQLVADFLGSYA
ncbi:hypothetical protein OUZ56_029275 [Daphnia magna]|uniref:Uncharacterized protein n=1 Tax=Daphnia magna TaxID=35525 RepID=A0ABR0B6D2_9CRUS|nr:hypothetical protein OUZ56_029275 [Daphnia magna]